MPSIPGNGVTSGQCPVGEKGMAPGGPPSITLWLHKKPTHTSQQAYVLHILLCLFYLCLKSEIPALCPLLVFLWPLGAAGGPPTDNTMYTYDLEWGQVERCCCVNSAWMTFVGERHRERGIYVYSVYRFIGFIRPSAGTTGGGGGGGGGQ